MQLLALFAAVLNLASGQAGNQAPTSSTPEALQAIRDFGRCVAERSPQLAAETLARDFTTSIYRSELGRLARVNESCFRGEGRMRTDNLLFAGAIAETLLTSHSDAVNVRLARAATRTAIPARSDSDRTAICLVRAAPDEVGALFATAAASEAEAEALRALGPTVARCTASGPRLEASGAGLRAILATAAFRSVAEGGDSTGGAALNR